MKSSFCKERRDVLKSTGVLVEATALVHRPKRSSAPVTMHFLILCKRAKTRVGQLHVYSHTFPWKRWMANWWSPMCLAGMLASHEQP